MLLLNMSDISKLLTYILAKVCLVCVRSSKHILCWLLLPKCSLSSKHSCLWLFCDWYKRSSLSLTEICKWLLLHAAKAFETWRLLSAKHLSLRLLSSGKLTETIVLLRQEWRINIYIIICGHLLALGVPPQSASLNSLSHFPCLFSWDDSFSIVKSRTGWEGKLGREKSSVELLHFWLSAFFHLIIENVLILSNLLEFFLT